MLHSMEVILEAAKTGKAASVSVAAAHDANVLSAVIAARKEGIANSLLVGDEERIRALLHEQNEDASLYEIVHAETDQACAALAVKAVRDGRAGFLMKGSLNTSEFLHAVVNKETGLGTGRLLSHVMLYEIPAYFKLLAVTDGGMNPSPNLENKAGILENAAALFCSLGYERIYAACLCGSEVVSEKIPSTVDAQSLSAMAARWAPYNMTVYGPVGFDLAISRESSAHKGFHKEGAGEADILLCPNYETGNAVGKALTYFANAKSAGVVMGASVPIILASRSDTAETKLCSMALGKAAAAKTGGKL
ncbi:MAG TPA: phosphate acyltransferase [Clostridia bacterium]|nr:phosphate acyltransferase [Clostridia bacterium]